MVDKTLKQEASKSPKPATDIEKPAAQASAEAEAPKPKPKRRKLKRQISHGQVHILASFNNTIVSVTDERGNVLTSASAGGSGFRGSKKGTAYAASVAAEKAINDAKALGLSKADVIISGIGLGRESAIRTLINQRLAVENIKDKTSLPHGGNRPRKAKRN